MKKNTLTIIVALLIMSLAGAGCHGLGHWIGKGHHKHGQGHQGDQQ